MPFSADDVASMTAEVQQWLDQVVIGLNLCPFAAEPRQQRQIRFVISRAADTAALLLELQQELTRLADTAPEALETTLLILPQGWEDFEIYNELLGFTDLLLQQFGWEGEFQIASFHPQYCFADVEAEDASNLTNRSPYPLLHLLRESSIEAALAHYPHPERIPERNIEQMRNLSAAQRQQLFPYLL